MFLSLAFYLPLLLRLLIVVVLLGFLGGTVKAFWDLRLLLFVNEEEALHQLLINVITLLALVEILLTIFSYLQSGRVRVTFLVDTVLIVMLNEVISLWFKNPNFATTGTLIFIILSLVGMRILTIRFSPGSEEEE